MPEPLRVFLIRHGQTAWNLERRVLGRTDVPLDATGEAQARRLAAALPPVHALYASPLSRALQTARAIGEPTLEPDLQELDQGHLDGLDAAGLVARFGDFLSRWYEDPTGIRLPGGETLEEAQDRGLRALRRIAAAHRPGEAVAVVTHQMVISATLCGLVGEPLSRWRAYAHKNTAYTILDCDPAPRLAHLHVTAHLEEG